MTPLIRFTIAWAIGLLVTRWLEPAWPLVAFVGIATLGALLLYRQNVQARLWAGALLGVVVGASRLLLSQPTFAASHIAFYNDRPAPVDLIGVVVDEPEVRDYHINLRLRVETIYVEETPQPVEGLVLVRAARYPEYFYGDRVRVQGNLETPPIFEDFSYKDYLARFGIHALIHRPRLELLESGQGNPFWATMLAFKAQASHTINRILAEPYASLLNGILLGIETGIPRDLYEQFNLTGTSHIIVISGSNVSLVAGVLLLLGQKLWGKRVAPPLAIAGVILYTFLVGAEASVSRAAVMGTVWVVALWLGRPGLALNSLFLSGLVLTLLNPLILWDVGFQLSFVATLGLIILVPPLEGATFGLLRRWLKTEQVGLVMALLSELLILTLAAQIMTGPLLIYHFGRLSLVSLFSNLLILPAQPPLMLLGALATGLGLMWLPLGQMVGWLVWLPLAWSVWVVEWTARLPYASLELGTFPFWLLLLIYATLATGIWGATRAKEDPATPPRFSLPKVGSPTTRLVLTAVGTVIFLIGVGVWNLPDGRLHVAFLEVGQGDAILVTLPDGRQMLIDGGPSATQLNWRLGQEMPFWDRSIDIVVNTHPDADHLGGLVSVLERYAIAQTLVTDVATESQLYREWERELAAAQLVPTIGQVGMQLSLSNGVTATILNPGPPTQHMAEPNNHSIVLRLQYGQISFLLPGDIEAPIERTLVSADMPLTATVLKSPHHGSKTSSSDTFLEMVNPQIVVISVGADNHFGHPAPEVLDRYTERGLTVLRTDERGTIEFITDGERLWVETAH